VRLGRSESRTQVLNVPTMNRSTGSLVATATHGFTEIAGKHGGLIATITLAQKLIRACVTENE
jgi:hypothetical protein